MDQDGLKVLLVGTGAGEHALAWKLAQSLSVAHVYVVPGNSGTSGLPNVSNIRSVKANDYPALVVLAKDLGIGLVVAGLIVAGLIVAGLVVAGPDDAGGGGRGLWEKVLTS